LIENVERFTRIDLDLSDFEKERNHYDHCDVMCRLLTSTTVRLSLILPFICKPSVRLSQVPLVLLSSFQTSSRPSSKTLLHSICKRCLLSNTGSFFDNLVSRCFQLIDLFLITFGLLLFSWVVECSGQASSVVACSDGLSFSLRDCFSITKK